MTNDEKKEKEWIPAFAGMTKKRIKKIRAIRFLFVSFVFCCFFLLLLITDY